MAYEISVGDMDIGDSAEGTCATLDEVLAKVRDFCDNNELEGEISIVEIPDDYGNDDGSKWIVQDAKGEIAKLVKAEKERCEEEEEEYSEFFLEGCNFHIEGGWFILGTVKEEV